MEKIYEIDFSALSAKEKAEFIGHFQELAKAGFQGQPFCVQFLAVEPGIVLHAVSHGAVYGPGGGGWRERELYDTLTFARAVVLLQRDMGAALEDADLPALRKQYRGEYLFSPEESAKIQAGGDDKPPAPVYNKGRNTQEEYNG